MAEIETFLFTEAGEYLLVSMVESDALVTKERRRGNEEDIREEATCYVAGKVHPAQG